MENRITDLEETAAHLTREVEDLSTIVARQAAPTVLEHVASTYVVSPNYLKNNDFLYGGKVLPYLMQQNQSFDIDSPLDFEIVEYLLQKSLTQ